MSDQDAERLIDGTFRLMGKFALWATKKTAAATVNASRRSAQEIKAIGGARLEGITNATKRTKILRSKIYNKTIRNYSRYEATIKRDELRMRRALVDGIAETAFKSDATITELTIAAGNLMSARPDMAGALMRANETKQDFAEAVVSEAMAEIAAINQSALQQIKNRAGRVDPGADRHVMYDGKRLDEEERPAGSHTMHRESGGRLRLVHDASRQPEEKASADRAAQQTGQAVRGGVPSRAPVAPNHQQAGSGNLGKGQITARSSGEVSGDIPGEIPGEFPGEIPDWDSGWEPIEEPVEGSFSAPSQVNPGEGQVRSGSSASRDSESSDSASRESASRPPAAKMQDSMTDTAPADAVSDGSASRSEQVDNPPAETSGPKDPLVSDITSTYKGYEAAFSKIADSSERACKALEYTTLILAETGQGDPAQLKAATADFLEENKFVLAALRKSKKINKQSAVDVADEVVSRSLTTLRELIVRPPERASSDRRSDTRQEGRSTRADEDRGR